MNEEAAPRATPQRPDVEQRILAQYDALPPMQRRLADIILEIGGDLARWSATEIAERANVSKATAARFFRALGYTDFQEARRTARPDAPWGSPLRNLGGDRDGDTRDRAQHHFARDMENLRRTDELLERDALDQSARWLALASTTWIVGFRNSYALAQYAGSVVHSVKSGVRLIPTAGLDMAEDLAAVGGDDAGLVIGFRRRPQLLIPVMEMMRSAGARVVLVTDMSAEESPRLADKTIRCHNRGPGPFDSYAAAMSVLNLLVSEVSGHLGPEATRYIERVETVHARLGDLRSGHHTPE